MGFIAVFKRPLKETIKSGSREVIEKGKGAWKDWKEQHAEKKQKRYERTSKVKRAGEESYWKEKEKVAVEKGKARARTSFMDRVSAGFKTLNQPTRASASSIRKKTYKPKKKRTRASASSIRKKTYKPKKKRTSKKRRKSSPSQNESMLDRINRMI